MKLVSPSACGRLPLVSTCSAGSLPDRKCANGLRPRLREAGRIHGSKAPGTAPTGRSPLHRVRGKGAVCRADAGSQEKSVSERRARTMEVIKEQAPFVTAQDVLAGTVVYKSPVEYRYSSQDDVTSETTQNGVIYSSKIPGEEFSKVMKAFESQHAMLPRAGIRVIRSFQPDPNSYIVRWSIQWRKSMNEAPAVGEVSSKYTIDREGLVCRQEDTWEVLPRDSESGAPPSLQDCASLALARRPPASAAVLSVLPAFRLGLWASLKSNENYGGQLTREEFDVFAMQLVYACVGLGVSLAVLVGRFAYLIAMARSS